MGHVFEASPQALIPRPETELLVETALRALCDHEAPRALDLGTGSGAIAISIALDCLTVAMIATDCSPGGLDLARRNARTLRGQVGFYQGDWYAALTVARNSGGAGTSVSGRGGSGGRQIITKTKRGA